MELIISITTQGSFVTGYQLGEALGSLISR